MFSGLTANRTMQEMLSLANEMAQRIAYDTRDWTRLKKQATINGDGAADVNGVMQGTTAFDLPADFKRMLLTANVWRSTNTQAPMVFIPDTDEWLQRRAQGFYDAHGEWTMLGGKMHILPIMAEASPPHSPYLDRNCVKLFSGGFGDNFTNDADEFVLDERLLKLGMIWQWKAQKGSPYSEDMGTYGDALVLAMGNDSPAPIIMGRAPISANANVAYPWPLPT